MKAAAIRSFGGAEVIRPETLPTPFPLPGEAIVQLKAIGLNFADIYRRRGEYPVVPPSPFILGYEGAGIVVSGGDLPPGARVGFADVPRANAELVAASPEKLIPLPDDIDDETAAAILLQGMTAHYLLHDSHPVKAGELVVVHSAAGGVGLLLTQMARILGARVIATVSSRGKVEAAKRAGAETVIVTSEEDFVGIVRGLTDGRGPDVVYDAIGTTLAQSLELVRPRGTVVFYGWSGGEPPPVSPRRLMESSKTLTGGDLWNHLGSATERRARAAELFRWVREGRLKVEIAARFPLGATAEAHRFLEGRKAVGKVLLIP